MFLSILSPIYYFFSGVYLSVFIFRYRNKDEREFKVPLIIPFITLCTTGKPDVRFGPLKFSGWTTGYKRSNRFLGMSIILPVILKPNWAYFYALMVVLAGQGSTDPDVQPRLSGIVYPNHRLFILHSIYALQCSGAWIRPILYIFAALLWICAWNLQE